MLRELLLEGPGCATQQVDSPDKSAGSSPRAEGHPVTPCPVRHRGIPRWQVTHHNPRVWHLLLRVLTAGERSEGLFWSLLLQDQPLAALPGNPCCRSERHCCLRRGFGIAAGAGGSARASCLLRSAENL